MIVGKFEIILPDSIEQLDTSQEDTSSEVQSANPWDIVVEQPVTASILLICTVGIGIAIRWANVRNADDHIAQKRVHRYSHRDFINDEDIG